MSEELNFSGFDDNDDNDDIIDNSENKESENLFERHKNFGLSTDVIKKLEILIKAKKDENIIFPSVIFLKILDKFENNKKEAQENLLNFYCFLEKYMENIIFEELKTIINSDNDTNLDTFSFWIKKLKFEIFENLLNQRNIQLNDYLKKRSLELIEKGYEVKNVLNLMTELSKQLKKDKEIIESIISILKTYEIKGEFYKIIEKYIKDLNYNSPKIIYSIASEKQNLGNDLNQYELIEEIKRRNPIYFLDNIRNNIIRQLSIITSTYDEYKNYKDNIYIHNWVENIFPSLLVKYNNNENRIEITAKILAVISIANQIFTKKRDENKKGYKLRTIQLIDVLLFINKEKEKGLIEQISTGEGKSTIICALATFLALIGKKVDIVTSALNLAKRDVAELKDFYGMFNLTVDYVEHFNPKPYKANIVYGTFLEFEGDVLEELTGNRIIRGKRNFEVLIVDEIDNLFIDNIDGSTRLVYSTMGYQYLSPIFMNIFFSVKTYENELTQMFNNFISNMGVNEEEKTFLRNMVNDKSFRNKNIYPYIKEFVCKFLRQLYGMEINEDNEIDNEIVKDTEKKFLEKVNVKLHLPLNLNVLVLQYAKVLLLILAFNHLLLKLGFYYIVFL